jgi:flagellar export protein FliJ
MSAFRFRAAAALELRLQQERTAAGLLARAEAALAEARRGAAAADRVRADADAAFADVQCRGADMATLTWHRNWIDRCGATVERAARDVHARARIVEAAEIAWRDARRRRLSLERMRDRAWAQHREAQERLELKQLDEIGRLRHVLAADAGEPHTD